jgi:hypothetical protein
MPGVEYMVQSVSIMFTLTDQEPLMNQLFFENLHVVKSADWQISSLNA